MTNDYIFLNMNLGIGDFYDVLMALGYSDKELNLIEKKAKNIHLKYFKKLIKNGFDIGEENFLKHKDFLKNQKFLKEYEENQAKNVAEIYFNNYFLDRIFISSSNDNSRYCPSDWENINKKDDLYRDCFKENEEKMNWFNSLMNDLYKEKYLFFKQIWNVLFKEIQQNCIYSKSINKRNRPLDIFKDKKYVLNYDFNYYSNDLIQNSFYKDEIFYDIDYKTIKEMNKLDKKLFTNPFKHFYKIFEKNGNIFVVYYLNNSNEKINGKIALQIFTK